MPDAEIAAKALSRFKRNGFFEHSCKLGDWFVIHEDGSANGTGFTMVDGPYESKERAEKERLANIKDKQCFDIDCNRKKGFVGVAVKIVSHKRAVIERR